MKKMLFYILLAGVMSSCFFSRKKNMNFDKKYDDTTALKSFVFEELKNYMVEVDSLPCRTLQSAYALIFDTIRYRYLDIFGLYPVMPYLADGYYNDTIYRLVGCFYKDTVLIAIYDRSDISPQGIVYYDTAKLDMDIKNHIPSDTLMQYLRENPYGEIGPKWHYQIIGDSLKLLEKGKNWVIIK